MLAEECANDGAERQSDEAFSFAGAWIKLISFIDVNKSNNYVWSCERRTRLLPRLASRQQSGADFCFLSFCVQSIKVGL